MDLKAYFESLDKKAVSPRTEFVEQIMKACHVESRSTVYRWLNGSITPGKLQQEKIIEIASQIAGKPVEILFPIEKNA